MEDELFNDPQVINAIINGVNGYQRNKKKQSPKKEDKLKNIYKNYPALKAMGKVILKADTSFTKDKTGAGSIEYFSPKQDTVTYDTGYKYGHPQKGKHGIVYNPHTNTEQDIALDMLHGMTADKTYNKYRSEFSDTMVNSEFGEDLKREWQQYNEETQGENDGFEQFKNNWIDGTIRNLMFKGTPEDFKKSNYWEDARKVYLSNKEIGDKFSKIEGYLKTGKRR